MVVSEAEVVENDEVSEVEEDSEEVVEEDSEEVVEEDSEEAVDVGTPIGPVSVVIDAADEVAAA